jgi:hypothetical protein
MSYLSILSTFFYTSGGFLWLTLIAGLILAWVAYVAVSVIYNTVSERVQTRGVRKALLCFIVVDAALMAVSTFVIVGILIASLLDTVAPLDKQVIFAANIVLMTILLQGFAYLSINEATYRLRGFDVTRSV